MKTALVEKIKSAIRQKGEITFERFMAMALYEPGLGYYASPGTVIGRAGDFYTSPHLHPAFGWMLARQMEECRERLGGGGLDVIEQGPGQGWLAKDILDYLKDRPAYQDIRYHLLELNPDLASAQKELLKDHTKKTSWISSYNELKNIKGMVLSNELLDAFPVHVIEKQGGWKEVYLTLKGDEFTEELGPLSSPELDEYLSRFISPEDFAGFRDGYRTEADLAMKKWIKDVSGALSEGFLITVDYGYPALDYYSPERDRGTLLAYYRHETTEDFFSHIGEEDMTAHVNFSALKKWGEEEGFKALGFCPQGTYLVSAGIDEVMAALSPDDILRIKGLILPGTMGETHKVMAQYKGEGSPDLRGFRLRNLIRTL